jgi:putative flippase GtrA
MSTTSFASGAISSMREKGPRYIAVSVVNVIVGQGLLLLFHAVLHWNQVVANAVSVCISAVPAYYLSRAWVWGRTGRSHFKTEVLPFWIFIGIGLVFSTAMVALVSHLTGAASTPASQLTLAEKLLPNIVNAASFFVLWILRFFLFEKLFTTNPELAEELLGADFATAIEGPEAVAAAEQAQASAHAEHDSTGPTTGS